MEPWTIPLVVAAAFAGYALGRWRRGAARPAAATAAAASPRERLLAIARELVGVYDAMPHPDDLGSIPPYREAVALLAGPAMTAEDLIGYLVGDNAALACAAADATAQRPEFEGREHELVSRLEGVSVYARTFLLRTIGRAEDPAVALDVLLASDGSWSSAMGTELLRAFLRDRIDAAYAQGPEARTRLARLEPGQVAWIRNVLEPLDSPGADAVRAQLDGGTSGEADLGSLRAFARVLDADDSAAEPLPCRTQTAALAELRAALRNEPPRSLLLVGHRGVGKATIVDLFARELIADGWTVFVAGATQLMAGQSYVGQIEQRIVDLVRAVGGRPKVLWLAPDLAEFLTAGRTSLSPTGLLDLLLPHLVSGELRILAPLEPAAAELLARQAPTLRTAALTVRLEEAGAEETLAMGRRWLERAARAGTPLGDDDLLHDVYLRSRQHVVDLRRPGSLLWLLASLRDRLTAAGAARPATVDDVIALISRLTGLPPAVLDERDGLDLDGVRRAFAARVVGQPEAVDCLVERIAMLKAGLCDPRRPVGVFLFTGPTGTGKTELCRALASYLFGSEDRLLRLDMSEFQQVDAIARITGDGDDVHGRRALVHQVREQPFSVVLLDEIEKAHPLVFDLFLQVFDAGRLTDRRGRATDFCHTIVIMTSNLGVKDLEGAGLGFGGGGPDLHRALEEVFRREFLNRVDRVVVFRSLEPATLREVLRKELDLVLQRRGLKSRPWAVEWDESALQFLLAKGYSPSMGARPLRRAIERHVLAPLASAIVTDRTPAGDQFLFVRSDGRSVRVEFVDPDAAPPAGEPAAPVPAGLRALARDGTGEPAEARAVERELAALAARVAGAAWSERKERAYAAMGEADFWTSDRRHEVLGLAELHERVGRAVAAAAERARGLAEHGCAAAELRDVAARALLLQMAIAAVERGEPQDAFLAVGPVHDPNGDAAAATAFAAELVGMYRSWAASRGMQWRALADGGGRVVAAVSGFAAWPVLATERGLHVLDDGGGRPRRCRVRVQVVAQPPEPAAGGAERELAERLLRAAGAATPVIVRRYHRGPSPQVRDRVRGWRTGRLDRVLAGDFDLIE